MNDTEHNNPIKDKVLEKIRAGTVAMNSKLYYALQLFAIGGLSALIASISVFIVNFIFFSIRINSSETLLRFGVKGFSAFIHFFPWHLLALDIILIGLLEWLLRRFKFAYRTPILFLLAGLLTMSIFVGAVIDRATPFNDRMYAARNDHLPRPIGGMYDKAHRRPPHGSGICRCAILAIEGSMLTVEDARLGTSTVKVILPKDDRRATTTNLAVGDVVFIAGKEKDGIIEAFGVRKEQDRPTNN